MIPWLDWAMLALVKIGGVIWLVGAVASTARDTASRIKGRGRGRIGPPLPARRVG